MNAIEAAARIAECFDEDAISHSLAAVFAHSTDELSTCSARIVAAAWRTS